MADSEGDFTNLFKKKPKQDSPPEQEDDQEPWAPEPLDYNPAEWYYDMGGDKIMLIFNHYRYKKTNYFPFLSSKQPEPRTGTARDVRALENTFSKFGFQVTTHHDKKQLEILNILRELCAQDHRNTSCVCVSVLTHGKRDGELCAADKTYNIKDLLNTLQTASSLVGKPKMLIVQACRGGLVDPGQEVKDDGPVHVELLPTHVDTLVLTSSVEDYMSWRNKKGSWLIQELCRVVHATHAVLDVQQMIVLVTSLVARERQTQTPPNKKNLRIVCKQTPEMRSTLTKLLRLTPPPLI